MDIRHQDRIKIVQELYSLFFTSKQDISISTKTELIKSKESKINEFIHEFAPKFPIDKIAKIDLAILQLSIYDLIIERKQPVKVVINEAVDLAKELGSDRSFAFVNAVLGKIYEKYQSK
jgi:transcription antitermination protein NusB